MIARPENVLIHGQHLNAASANCADGVDADETAGLDLNADARLRFARHSAPPCFHVDPPLCSQLTRRLRQRCAQLEARDRLGARLTGRHSFNIDPVASIVRDDDHGSLAAGRRRHPRPCADGPSPQHPRAHREQEERDHDGEAHQTADLEWPVTAHAAPSRRRFGALRFRIVSSDSRSSENSFPCRTRHAEQQTDRCTGRQTFHGFPLLNSAASQVAPTLRGQADAAPFSASCSCVSPRRSRMVLIFTAMRSLGPICTLSGTVGQRASALDLAGTMVAVSLPGYLVPMQPMLGQPFHRSGWIYEEKYDGWRMLALKDGGRVRLVSRHQVDHTERFRALAAAIAVIQGAHAGPRWRSMRACPDDRALVDRLMQRIRAWELLED